jgi:hypothetical protein
MLAYASRNRLKYTPMNMQFLCEEPDNKGYRVVFDDARVPASMWNNKGQTRQGPPYLLRHPTVTCVCVFHCANTRERGCVCVCGRVRA